MMHAQKASDIERWLIHLQKMSTAAACTGPAFAKPFHLVTLAHVLRARKIHQLSMNDVVGRYADSMNLWGALGMPSPFGLARRPATRGCYPMTLLTDPATIDEVADSLARLFRTVCLNEDTIDAVQTMLRELIGNCYAHADVQDGVYGAICAQLWPAGRKAQIAIADAGVGIRNSLAQNPLLAEQLKHANSCEVATEYGVTGKPGRGHSGYGLAVARKLLEQNKGVLFVRSGREGFYQSAAQGRNLNMAHAWSGTLLIIEWNLDEKVDIGDVYGSFPLPEGMSDDDFNF